MHMTENVDEQQDRYILLLCRTDLSHRNATLEWVQGA